MLSKVRVMRHREVAVALAATVLVLLVRWYFGFHLQFCGTPDTCAYLSLGQSLSLHHGFDQDFLYQYQFVSHHLPAQGIEYWRPGVSLLLLLTVPFGGVTLHSTMVLTSLAGVLLALAAWKIASDSTGDARVACAAYLLCLLLPPEWGGSLSPDSPLFYGLFAAWFLALFAVRWRGYASDAAALFCVACVNLIRNDAILLLPALLVVLWLRRRAASADPQRGRGASLTYAALTVVGFFAAMLPMALIYHAVLGSFGPGSTVHVLFLNDLSDLERYGAPLSLHSALSAGVLKLIKLRIVTLPLIVYRLVFLQVGFGVVFLAIFRPWKTAARPSPRPEFAGGLAFGLAIVLVYGLVLPAIGVFSALRAGIGLLPLVAVYIVLACMSRSQAPWITEQRPLLAAVLCFYCVMGVMEDKRSVADKNAVLATDRKVASFLAAHGALPRSSAVIMTADAGQFAVTTGYKAVPIPSNGLQAARDAATDLGATDIVIDDDAWTQAEIQSFNPTAVERVAGTPLILLELPRRW